MELTFILPIDKTQYEENHAAVEEVATSSNNLAKLSNNLKQSIRRFKLA
jgi:methyl-accepting chemotaxis protein